MLATAQCAPPCAVCRAVQAAYTCPRCSARYCSARCFQGHGASCTELFYRAQVAAAAGEALPHARVQRLSALGGLLRAGEGCSAGAGGANGGEVEEEEEGEEEAGLDEGEAAVLRALALAVDAAPTAAARERAEAALEAAMSPAATRAFRRCLAQGEAQRLCGVTPWWVEGSPTPPPFGAPAGAGAGAAPAAAASRPLRPLVPPLSALRPAARGPPAPALANSALEVLAAYAHAYLLFDGDLAPAGEAAGALLALAACLSADARYASPRAACAAALAAASGAAVRLTPLPSPALSLRVLADCVAHGLLARPCAALDALLHAWVCVRAAAASAAAPLALRAAEKKLGFLCAWAAEQLGGALCSELQEAVLGVCEEGMAGLVGAAVAGQGRAGGGAGSAGAGAPSAPKTALGDALAGRLLQRRSTFQGLPACLLLERKGGR